MNENSKAEYWLGEDGLTLIKSWRRNGCGVTELAERIGVDMKTLYRWRQQFPEIEEAMRQGKEVVDFMVENALLKAALGYKTKEIKVTLGKKVISGETFNVLKETTTKEVGPNVTACLAWLNNRKPSDWRHNRDNTIPIDENDTNVTVTIVRGKGNPDAEKSRDKDAEKKEEDNVNESVSFRVNSPISLEEAEKRDRLDNWPDEEAE